MDRSTQLIDPHLFRRPRPSEVVTSADAAVVPLTFSMTPPPPFIVEPPPPPPAAPNREAAASAGTTVAAAAGSRLAAKRRPIASPCDTSPAGDTTQPYCVTSAGDTDAATVVASPAAIRAFAEPQPYCMTSQAEMEAAPQGESIQSQPYCIASLAEAEEAAVRALAKRRSVGSVRDSQVRDSLQVLQDICYRRLSTADLAAAVDDIADPCAFRNLHFDEPPSAETASTVSAATTVTASRRSSRAGTGTPDALLAGSRRGSCCYSCQDVIANRRRVSCFTEGAATPAMYQCNGTRCGGSHHCPEAFDDPCCGAAAEDFWVQAYYNEERRKRTKRAKTAARAAKAKGAARRVSRAPTPGAAKRGSGLGPDLEASKEVVSAADKKRRWVVYICATFVVMLVALAVLMVIVSLSMGNRAKAKANATTEAAAVEALTVPSQGIDVGE